VRPQVPHVRSYRSQLSFDPITAVSYRATDFVFTTRVEPVSPPQRPAPNPVPEPAKLVEAPGTAPGSATLIPQAVYRHSRLPDRQDIGSGRPKGNRADRLQGRLVFASPICLCCKAPGWRLGAVSEGVGPEG